MDFEGIFNENIGKNAEKEQKNQKIHAKILLLFNFFEKPRFPFENCNFW